MIELERRERDTIYRSTEYKIIHFSDQYDSSNNVNVSVAQGQKPSSSDLIPRLRRL